MVVMMEFGTRKYNSLVLTNMEIIQLLGFSYDDSDKHDDIMMIGNY